MIPHLIFWLGAFLDFATTRKGLKSGFTEGNPVVKYILDKLPFDSEIELAGTKLVVYGFLVLTAAPPWAYYLFGGAQIFAALWNFRLMRRAGVL